MEPNPSIQAAPNRSHIRGAVTGVAPDDVFPDKFWIDFEIVASDDLPNAPNFAKGKIGEKIRGFTFGEVSPLRPGDRFSAAAEYVGDARNGLFRLSDIQKQPE